MKRAKSGPKPPALDDPRRFTRRLKAGRVDFDPNIVPTILAFFLMLERRYQSAAANLRGKSSGLNESVKAGMLRRLDGLADACGVLAQDARSPWSGFQWTAAVGEVQAALRANWPIFPSQEPNPVA